MSGKVLYRKYRPTKLSEVVGQPQVTDTLENALKQGKLGHAYLFIGPRGTGKTSVARIFAHAVNGFDYQLEDNYLDIIEIDAASNTGVDNIRELREKAIIAPTKGKYKVYIIDEVHMLTKSASNALLKTLEEPPSHVIFIMATTDAHKVPITISSRTQVFTFKLADPEIMLQHLQAIAAKEQIPITEEALQLVVRRGGGSFRDSLSLLDQISSLTDQEITAEILSQALGLPQEQIITNLLQAYESQDSTQITNLLKDLLNTGIKPEIIASELITKIIQQPEPNLLPLLEQLPKVQPPFPEAKLLLAFLQPTSHTTVAPTLRQNFSPSTESSRPANTSVAPNLRQPLRQKLQPTPSPETSTPEPPQPEANTSAAPESSSTSDTPSTATPPVNPSGTFDWDTFIAAVHEVNGAVYQQLLKSEHEFSADTLHLYPNSTFTKKILSTPGNNRIIVEHLGGFGLMIHEVDEDLQPKDETLSQISAIMGNVREITTESPFE